MVANIVVLRSVILGVFFCNNARATQIQSASITFTESRLVALKNPSTVVRIELPSVNGSFETAVRA